MQAQLSFDLEPRRLARRRDPVTSHAAAGKVHDFAQGDYALILRGLRDIGPSTYHEIAEHFGIEAHKLGRRMGELEEAGRIAVVVDGAGGEMTRLTPAGRKARVWYPL